MLHLHGSSYPSQAGRRRVDGFLNLRLRNLLCQFSRESGFVPLNFGLIRVIRKAPLATGDESPPSGGSAEDPISMSHVGRVTVKRMPRA